MKSKTAGALLEQPAKIRSSLTDSVALPDGGSNVDRREILGRVITV